MQTSRLARFVSMLMLAAVLATTMAAGAAAQGDDGGDPGNSGAARACQQGGYTHWLTTGGDTFPDTGACVSYAAEGGTLVPIAHAACLGGNHASMARSVAYALAFTSEAECRAYLDRGGEIVAWQRGFAYAYTDMQYSVWNGRLVGCSTRAVVHVDGYSEALVTFTGFFAPNNSPYPRTLYNAEWSTWAVPMLTGGNAQATVTVQGAWLDWSTGTYHYGDVLIENWSLSSYCPYG